MTFQLTRIAARFIRMMVMTDGGPESGLRMVINPAGCSGLSADINVVTGPQPGDHVFEQDGARLFMPEGSRLLLDGVTIDFVDSVAQTGLTFRDPRPKVTCSSSGITPVQIAPVQIT